MFNNDNEKENGELWFLETIKNDVKVIFDVGCRDDSLFLDLDKEVHYFDPNTNFISQLIKKPNNNISSKFNNFGLSNSKCKLSYYNKFQSFVDRRKTCGNYNETTIFNVDTALNYLKNNKISNIDFLKIDTEGYELFVILGFEERIKDVKIIQFEYGGTFIDADIKLINIVNHLKKHGFNNFYYLSPNELIKINDYTDNYNYCNIVSFNDKFPELNKWKK